MIITANSSLVRAVRMSGLCFTAELHKIALLRNLVLGILETAELHTMALLRNLALGILKTPDSEFRSGKTTNFSRGNSA